MANELDQSLAQFKFCSFCDGSKCKSETSIKASGIFFGCNLHFSLLYNSYYFLILSTVSILLINIFCFKDECDLYILFIIVLKKSFFIFFLIYSFFHFGVLHTSCMLHVGCRLYSTQFDMNTLQYRFSVVGFAGNHQYCQMSKYQISAVIYLPSNCNPRCDALNVVVNLSNLQFLCFQFSSIFSY